MTPPTEKVIIFLVHKTWFPKSDRKTAKDARKLKKKKHFKGNALQIKNHDILDHLVICHFDIKREMNFDTAATNMDSLN